MEEQAESKGRNVPVREPKTKRTFRLQSDRKPLPERGKFARQMRADGFVVCRQLPYEYRCSHQRFGRYVAGYRRAGAGVHVSFPSGSASCASGRIKCTLIGFSFGRLLECPADILRAGFPGLRFAPIPAKRRSLRLRASPEFPSKGLRPFSGPSNPWRGIASQPHLPADQSKNPAS